MKQVRRYLMIGAHPDDADIRFGGTALKLTRAGHVVKFVSMCNGDSGHFDMNISHEALAERRYKETQASRAVSGISEYQVFHENHDCELEPNLENRKKVIRLIRNFKPDVVLTHRLCDYHADHRATGTAVLDAIYMLGVPLYCPDVPVPEMLPFVMYTGDAFTLPRPFRVDMIVAADDVRDQLVEGFACHVSQVFEWLPPQRGVDPKTIGTDHASRIAYVKARNRGRSRRNGIMHRELFKEVFGEANAPQLADVYELSEYGRKPCKKELEFLKSLGFKWVLSK